MSRVFSPAPEWTHGWKHIYSFEQRLSLSSFFFIGNFPGSLFIETTSHVSIWKLAAGGTARFISILFFRLPGPDFKSNRRAHSPLHAIISRPFPWQEQIGWAELLYNHFFLATSFTRPFSLPSPWRKDELQWYYNMPLSIYSCRRSRTTNLLTTNSDFPEEHLTKASLAL